MTTKPKTRKRSLLLKQDSVFDRSWRTGSPDIYNQKIVFSTVATQKTVSEGHPWSNEGYRGEDIGGPFYTEKKYTKENRRDNSTKNPMYAFKDLTPIVGNRNYIQFGPLYAVDPNDVAPFTHPPAAASTDAELDAWGTKAIALCKPTNSVVDLSTALGELMMGGLPRMIGASTWETRLRDIRASGDEYLNVTFGWLPLISDIRKAAIDVRSSRDILAQYERDAGRLVRRRFEFPLQKEVGPINTIATNQEVFRPNQPLKGGFYGNFPLLSNQGVLSHQRTTEVKRWFSGAFTYYLPEGYDSRSALDRAGLAADRIYGLSFSPETLWNLAPWSWAADWAANVGDVISNVSDFITDGLLLRYGYMMEHSIVTDTYVRSNVPIKGHGNVTFSLQKITEVKQRRPATPFGFGLTFDGLSTKQKAILTALGITRVR